MRKLLPTVCRDWPTASIAVPRRVRMAVVRLAVPRDRVMEPRHRARRHVNGLSIGAHTVRRSLVEPE
jgi:hypothetical protein